MQGRNRHNIIKQCVWIQCECALVAVSHGYILKVHMNEHDLLDNVMWVDQVLFFPPFLRGIQVGKGIEFHFFLATN